ncbi:MAG TPA: serine/threonine-protein kinase [Gemmataceae bacterium]|nr:serine/threonine-protein kinase [Gemmataceae bacterium]
MSSSNSPIPEDAEAQELLDGYLRDLQAGRLPDRGRIISARPDLASSLNCLEALEKLAPSAPASADAVTLSRHPEDGAPLPPTSLATSPGQGDFVGKYQIIRELGRGGMGVVYLARDTDLKRMVALKMILAGSMAGEEYRQRFQAEIRAAAKLEHEGIVRIYDTGEFNGLPYLAMQFIDGPSLAECLGKKKFHREDAARCVAHLARTVEYLHSQGIVHRDLKPANVLLEMRNAELGMRNEGKNSSDSAFRIPNSALAKITDFGVAKILEEDSHATRTGMVVGTPGYMSPEQARGESRTVGPAADVYSLGAILYEMLTGRPPFVGDTPLVVLLQVMSDEPLAPRRFDPKIPRDLEFICLKCLEKAPERRYRSAAELAQALELHLKGEILPVSRLTLWEDITRLVRRMPAVAARVGILFLVIFVLILRAIQSGNDHFSKTIPWIRLHHIVLALGVWIGLSALFQRMLRTERGNRLVPYLWSFMEVLLLTTLLLVTDSFESPIDIGYPLLIAAAGLWVRERLVWFTTLCAVVGYGIASVVILLLEAGDNPHRHVIFIIGLVLMGYLVTYQVRRFRSLSRYYEGRPLEK